MHLIPCDKSQYMIANNIHHQHLSESNTGDFFQNLLTNRKVMSRLGTSNIS